MTEAAYLTRRIERLEQRLKITERQLERRFKITERLVLGTTAALNGFVAALFSTVVVYSTAWSLGWTGPALPILGWLLLTIVWLVSYLTLYLWLGGLGGGGPVGEWEDAAAKLETEWDHAVRKLEDDYASL